MISQSIPNLMMAAVTFVLSLSPCFSISVPLTLFVMLSIILMLNVIRIISRRSGRFFGTQRVGAVNGYIEEMMHGQKVKIFNHEKSSWKNLMP